MDSRAHDRFRFSLSLLSEGSEKRDVVAVVEALDALLAGSPPPSEADRAALQPVHDGLWALLGGPETLDARLIAELQALAEGRETGPSRPPAMDEKLEPGGPAASPGSGDASYNPEDLPILAEFVQEARGHLETAEAELLHLEGNPSEEGVNALFRAYHSLKGSAGFLGLKAVNAVCHEAESLLDGVRKREYALDAQGVELLLGSVDHLRAQIDALAAGMERPGSADAGGRVPFAAPACGPSVGALAALRSAMERREPAHRRLGDILLDMRAVDEETLQSALATQRSGEAPPGPTAAPEAVKVGVEKLDALVNLVGELVISHTIVAGRLGPLARDEVLTRELGRLGKTVRDLQGQALAMRMVPVRQSFQKMVRLVRDLAKAQGKQVSLELSGEETELDKTVIEEITDPLVHLLRNAVDHGVETPAERRAAGKSPVASIRLGAFHRGDNIVLRVEDDGRGLDRARILAKAVRLGLVPAGAEPPDEELWEFIFHAGFSTAEQVSQVSGRGVGMDVVRKNIHRLRGKIVIRSEPGRGTDFEIQLPLTLAIIDGMVVRVAGQRFIVPTLGVREFLELRKSPVYTVHERSEVLHVRGSVLPLVRLGEFCSRGAGPACAGARGELVVVVENADRACGLVVDELVGQQQVVVKSLGDRLKHVEGISGGAILGDGTVGLILDLPGVLRRLESASAPTPAAPPLS